MLRGYENDSFLSERQSLGDGLQQAKDENRLTNPRLVRSVRLRADVGSSVRSDRAIESGKDSLDKSVVQHLHDRLPGGDVRSRELPLQFDLGCNLLRTAILEEMGSAANH